MYTFINRGGRADHEIGSHDDLIFGLILAMLIVDKGKEGVIDDFFVDSIKDKKELITETQQIIEDLDKFLSEDLKEKDPREHDKFSRALMFGVQPEYISAYELLINDNEEYIR